MPFAKINKQQIIKAIKDLSLAGKEQSVYFHFEEIELLMKQPKAEAITVKQITVDNESYIVLMAISNKATLDGTTTLNELGNLLVLPCPRPAIPFGGVEIKIDAISDILETVEQSPEGIEKTINILEQQKMAKKHEIIRKETLDYHEIIQNQLE